jgi:MFS family permease
MMYQLAIVVGAAVAPLIAYLVVKILGAGFDVTDTDIPDDPWLQAWRWMFFSETVCVAAFVLFVFGLPFSPRWLAEKGAGRKRKIRRGRRGVGKDRRPGASPAPSGALGPGTSF